MEGLGKTYKPQINRKNDEGRTKDILYLGNAFVVDLAQPCFQKLQATEEQLIS